MYVETSDFLKAVWTKRNMSEGQVRFPGCQFVTFVMNHGELPSVASISCEADVSHMGSVTSNPLYCGTEICIMS